MRARDTSSQSSLLILFWLKPVLLKSDVDAACIARFGMLVGGSSTTDAEVTAGLAVGSDTPRCVFSRHTSTTLDSGTFRKTVSSTVSIR